jgi:hypothetical protein
MREWSGWRGRRQRVDGGAAVWDVVEHVERDERIGRGVWVVVVTA